MKRIIYLSILLLFSASVDAQKLPSGKKILKTVSFRLVFCNDVSIWEASCEYFQLLFHDRSIGFVNADFNATCSLVV